MAIEPLGSMTAVQVQSATKVVQVEPKKVEVNKDVQTLESGATPMMEVSNQVVVQTAESNTNQNDNQQDEEKNLENVRKAVDNLNKNMKNTSAIFGIHEGTNRVTIKIVDKQTKEVIKELPPEKTLDMISRVWEMAGMLVDEKR